MFYQVLRMGAILALQSISTALMSRQVLTIGKHRYILGDLSHHESPFTRGRGSAFVIRASRALGTTAQDTFACAIGGLQMGLRDGRLRDIETHFRLILLDLRSPLL
jgi:hypothetical protein